MMYIKISMLAAVLLFTACSKETITVLSITTSIDETESVTVGTDVELEIKVIDGDEVDWVSIDIPALNSYERYEQINEKKWSITRTLEIDDRATRGTSDIIVVVKDKNGEEREASSSLTIE